MIRQCQTCGRHYPIPFLLQENDPECPYVRCGIDQTVHPKWDACDDWKEESVINRICATCKNMFIPKDEEPCKTCAKDLNQRPLWSLNAALEKIEDSKDQTAKADAGKLDLTLVPRQIIWAIAAIREYGNQKYGDPDNWKTVEIERYRAAAFRHFMAYLDDPTGVDAESGKPHLWHLACNVAFLCEMEAME